MNDPKQYLECLLRQLDIIEARKTEKQAEIREHINRYDLNKTEKKK